MAVRTVPDIERDAEMAIDVRAKRIGYAEASADELARHLASRAPVHWKCPTCLAPCRCTGDARLLPHLACGLTPTERS